MKDRLEVSDELAAQGFRSEEQIRRKLNLAAGTLRVWRSIGRGPRFYRIGKTVYYRDSDVDAWIDQQARTPACVAA